MKTNMDVFYNSDDEKIGTQKSDYVLSEQILDSSIFIKLTSIILIRAGLFLSHVSSVPSSNIQTLIFQNIIDLSVNTVVYGIIGYLFAYGDDYGGFIGLDSFLSDKSDKNNFAEGWIIIVAVSGLLIVAIGDRISFFASFILNLLISGAVFPILIHWILSSSGWMRGFVFNKVKVSYKDYSYGCLIHMSGGFLSCLSMLVMNKRIMRFKDMDICSIPDNGPSLTLFGNFLMLVGFFGISIPTENYLLGHLEYNFYGIILTNMLLSAFGSMATALLLTFTCPCEPLHKWTGMRSMQASMAGVAVIASGADVYYPMAALLIGLCNGGIYFFVSFMINNSPIEDYSNVIACHLVSGFIGTLLPPVFGIREGFSSNIYFNFFHFIWQLICNFIIMSFIFIVFLPIMALLDYGSILRSWDEDINHRRAMFASKRMKNDPSLPQTSNHRTSIQNTTTTTNAPKSSQNKTHTKERSKNKDVTIQQENVDVLFDKSVISNATDKELKRSANVVVRDDDDDVDDDLIPCSSNVKDGNASEIENYEQKDEELAINYVVNSKPVTFFEEIDLNSRENSQVVLKNCGDTFENEKFFDIRLVKSIKNISDSKLFQKFKGNWSVPKKRTSWNKERNVKFGSMSNVWIPGVNDITFETQV